LITCFEQALYPKYYRSRNSLETIWELRKRIDEVDERILHLLKERVEICKTIGATKRAHGIPIRDPSRENELCRRVMEEATKLGLTPNQVESVYREIIAMCIYAQTYNKKT